MDSIFLVLNLHLSVRACVRESGRSREAIRPVLKNFFAFFSCLLGCLCSTEWNDGMEPWNGMKWNDHAHRARIDDLYPLCLLPSTKKH